MPYYRNIKFLLGSTLILFAAYSFNIQNTGKLTVVVNNIDTPSGEVRVAIYNSEKTFLDPKKFVSVKSMAVGSQKSVTLEFTDLPYGNYAVTTYHDINSNRKLDQNTFGIPEEPYDMTNLKVKWRKPTFNEVKFPLQAAQKTVQLHLKRWVDR
jgi:uncharacterized protein (DUF2141 family)